MATLSVHHKLKEDIDGLRIKLNFRQSNNTKLLQRLQSLEYSRVNYKNDLLMIPEIMLPLGSLIYYYAAFITFALFSFLSGYGKCCCRFTYSSSYFNDYWNYCLRVVLLASRIGLRSLVPT